MRSVWPGCSRAITVVRPMSSVASEVTLTPSGPAHLVVHRRGHPQAGAARVVQQRGARLVAAVLLGDQRVGERRLDARVRLVPGGQLLVGHQLRLHDEQGGRVEHLDLVADRGDRPLGERHQPGAAHPHHPARGRGPLDLAGERAGPQVEHPLVAAQLAVAQVERLVLDQQPDQLAVGDVDDRLAGLRVAVPALGVRQRPPLVERVQVGARHRVRLPLVEVAAQPDVPVGQREHRLDLADRGPGRAAARAPPTARR